MRTPVKGSIDDRSMPVTAAPTSRMQMRHHCVWERFRETEMPHLLFSLANYLIKIFTIFFIIVTLSFVFQFHLHFILKKCHCITQSNIDNYFVIYCPCTGLTCLWVAERGRAIMAALTPRKYAIANSHDTIGAVFSSKFT